MKSRFAAAILAVSCTLALAASPGGGTSTGGHSQAGSMAPPQTAQGDLIDAASASAHIYQLRNYIHRHMLQQNDFGGSQRIALMHKYGINDGESAMIGVGYQADGAGLIEFYAKNETALGKSLVNLLIKGHPNFIHKSVLDQMDRQVAQVMQSAPKVDALIAQMRDLDARIIANEAKMKAPGERRTLMEYSYGTAALRCRGAPNSKTVSTLCVTMIGTVHTPNSEFLRAHAGFDPAVEALSEQNFKLRRQQDQIRAQLKALETVIVTTVVPLGGGAMPPPPSTRAQDVPPDGRPD